MPFIVIRKYKKYSSVHYDLYSWNRDLNVSGIDALKDLYKFNNLNDLNKKSAITMFGPSTGSFYILNDFAEQFARKLLLIFYNDKTMDNIQN